MIAGINVMCPCSEPDESRLGMAERVLLGVGGFEFDELLAYANGEPCEAADLIARRRPHDLELDRELSDMEETARRLRTPEGIERTRHLADLATAGARGRAALLDFLQDPERPEWVKEKAGRILEKNGKG